MVPLTVGTFFRELTVSAVMTILATLDTALTASAVVMTKLLAVKTPERSGSDDPFAGVKSPVTRGLDADPCQSLSFKKVLSMGPRGALHQELSRSQLFFTSFTVPAIPNMPLCMANGDSLEIGLSESADSIIMKRGQCSLLGTVKGSLSTERSESESNRTNFLFVGFLLAILLMCGSPSLVPTHLGAQLGMCRAAVTSRYTPGIQGWYTRAMKQKRDVTLLD